MIAARRPRLSLLGGVLALVAMLGLIALTGWHNATVHDDGPIHIVSVEHDHHHPATDDDHDAPIHVLAHATGQWLAFAGGFSAPALFKASAQAWPTGLYGLRGGIEPSELLRPPRG